MCLAFKTVISISSFVNIFSKWLRHILILRSNESSVEDFVVRNIKTNKVHLLKALQSYLGK